MAPGQKTFTTVIQTLMQKASVFDIYKRFYPSPVFVRQAGLWHHDIQHNDTLPIGI